MKPFISAEEIRRLAREHVDSGNLLANVHMPLPPIRPRDPVVDEHGRLWVLPPDLAGMRALWVRYVRLHGRLSPAVDETFLRHRQLDQLRMLMLRCVEGEPVNLAARALALGPVPPRPRHPSWPADRPWFRDVEDARTREELVREDLRMRAAGYAE